MVLFAEPEFCAENYKGAVDENGLAHGEGEMKYDQRTTQYWLGYCDVAVAPKCYKGQWCHGVKCGEGKMTFYAPSDYQHYSYIGSWANDLPEGSGQIRVVDRYNKETITPINLVAGMREGRNTAVEFGKTIDCQWVSGYKEGEGVCTMPNGQQFRGVWRNDNLDLDSCTFMEAIEVPTLIVDIYHSGFDYSRRIVGLIEAKVGEYTLEDALPVLRDKGFDDSEPLITILSVEGGVVKYAVSSSYSEGNSPIVGTVAVDERVEHKHLMKCVATIYDDDYDYEIIRKIDIKCKK